MSNKFANLINNFKITIVILVLTIFITTIIDRTYAYKISTSNYVTNIVLLIVFCLMITFVIYNEAKLFKEMQKYESLLSFINKYEKMIEEQRINKHEMHNNLLILKSYKNKNSKEIIYYFFVYIYLSITYIKLEE